VGYGETLAKAIEGNWGVADDSDCMRLVDWAIRKGIADRDRVGLLGLSYGGYMTNWLLGHHPGRFAAAVSENPVLDLFSFYGSSDYGPTIAEQVTGIKEPWDDFARLLDRSPGSQLHRNKAPLLLLQAEADRRRGVCRAQAALELGLLRDDDDEVAVSRGWLLAVVAVDDDVGEPCAFEHQQKLILEVEVDPQRVLLLFDELAVAPLPGAHLVGRELLEWVEIEQSGFER